MARDYDPRAKALVEVEPASWLPLAGRPPAERVTDSRPVRDSLL